MRFSHRQAVSAVFLSLAILLSSTAVAQTEDQPITFFWLERSLPSYLGLRVSERIHLTERDGTFEVLPPRYGEELVIGFRDDRGVVYEAHFLPHDPEFAQPGLYNDPECDWFEPDSAVAPLRFDSLGLTPDFMNECVAGGFDILELDVDADGQVAAFAADFEYRGAGVLGDVRGRIRYRASPEFGSVKTGEEGERLRCDADPERCFGPFEDLLPAPELWPRVLEEDAAWGSLGLVWGRLPAIVFGLEFSDGPGDIMGTALSVNFFQLEPSDPIVLASAGWLTDEPARDPEQARREARGDGMAASRVPVRGAGLAPKLGSAAPSSAAPAPASTALAVSRVQALRHALRARASPAASLSSGSELLGTARPRPPPGPVESPVMTVAIERRNEVLEAREPPLPTAPDTTPIRSAVDGDGGAELRGPSGKGIPAARPAAAAPTPAPRGAPMQPSETAPFMPPETLDWLRWLHEFAGRLEVWWTHLQAGIDAWLGQARQGS